MDHTFNNGSRLHIKEGASIYYLDNYKRNKLLKIYHIFPPSLLVSTNRLGGKMWYILCQAGHKAIDRSIDWSINQSINQSSGQIRPIHRICLHCGLSRHTHVQFSGLSLILTFPKNDQFCDIMVEKLNDLKQCVRPRTATSNNHMSKYKKDNITFAAHCHNINALLYDHNLLKVLGVTRGVIFHFSVDLHCCPIKTCTTDKPTVCRKAHC